MCSTATGQLAVVLLAPWIVLFCSSVDLYSSFSLGPWTLLF
jgi:hypothetical protein